MWSANGCSSWWSLLMLPSKGLIRKHYSLHYPLLTSGGFVLFGYWLVLHIPLNANIRWCCIRALSGNYCRKVESSLNSLNYVSGLHHQLNTCSNYRTDWEVCSVDSFTLSLLYVLSFVGWHALFRWMQNYPLYSI